MRFTLNQSPGQENLDRKMEFFYIPNATSEGERILITGNEAKHIAKVLRHSPGDLIFGTDGRGNEFKLAIEHVSKKGIVCRVIDKKKVMREPRHFIALAQALLKGDKLAMVVEGVTELGVKEVIPFRSERTMGKVSEAKLRRLEKVAISGIKSSLRTVLPKISSVVDLGGLLSRFCEFDQVLLAYEMEQKWGLGQVLKRELSKALLIVGPEGGFTSQEAQQMREAGAISFTLGPRRLRAETAALAVSSVCLSLLGDLE